MQTVVEIYLVCWLCLKILDMIYLILVFIIYSLFKIIVVLYITWESLYNYKVNLNHSSFFKYRRIVNITYDDDMIQCYSFLYMNLHSVNSFCLST